MSSHPRHLEVIYCDDIREEVGSKFSYMGVYFNELTVPNAPVLLPKLCIVVKAATDINEPFEALEVRVVKVNGDEETDLLSTGPVAIPSSSEIPGMDTISTHMVAQFSFILSPFQIEEDTILRVKAITEREEILGTALRIRIIPTQPKP